MARRKPAEPWIISSFSLKPKMVDELNEIAEEMGISRSALIRVILSEYLAKKK